MHATPLLPILLAATLALTPPAWAQAPADQHDAELAFAQCMRDNDYAEFPDPTPDGGLRFQITPDSAPRFRKAAEACQHLAPEGMRDEGVTPEQMEGLLQLAQCVRDQGIADFPDPTSDGRFELRGAGMGPEDARLGAAMDACRDQLGPGGGRIMIGG